MHDALTREFGAIPAPARNRLTVTLAQPPPNYRYRVSWALPRTSEPNAAAAEARRAQFERAFLNLVADEPSRSSEPTGAVQDAIIEAVEDVSSELERLVVETGNFGHDVTVVDERTDFSLMVCDRSAPPPRLRLVFWNRQFEHPEAFRDFRLAIGNGNAGRAYKTRTLRLFDKGEAEAVGKPKAGTYVKLHGMPEVATVFYESKQQAYQHAQKLFRNQPDLLRGVSKDTFPASFRVKLADPSKFQVIQAQLQGQPGIERIVDQRDILKRLLAVAGVLKTGAYIASLVMLLSAIALIANTVRMAVFARRKEIGIMRLVGATSWFIRVPFMMEAVVEGLFGAVLAVFALAILKNSFFNNFRSSLGFWPVITTQDFLSLIPWLLAGGVVVAILASWLAMRRFLEI